MKDKVLILGGSHRDIPLIEAAKKLGYFTITLGDKDYYLGHQHSNRMYKVNFNNLDEVKKIIKKENIKHIIPGCGEESYMNTVKLAHELKLGNFDSLETATTLHNKWKFKEFCLKNNIGSPKGIFYKNNNSYKELKFPIVIKPTTLSAGRGVSVVYNEEEFKTSLQIAKKISNEIFLEEFIDGELLAYSVFLKNEEILYGFLGVDKPYINKYLISTAYPTYTNDETLKELKFDIEKIAKKLNLVDGMFHLQVIIRNDKPYIIDVTRRIAGDFYPYLIEHSDHVKYSQAVVNSYLGVNITNEFENNDHEQSFIIRHCVMASKNGIYKKLVIDSSIEDKIIYKFDLLQNNDKIDDYMYNLVSIVLIKLNTKNDKITDNINRLIYPIVEG